MSNNPYVVLLWEQPHAIGDTALPWVWSTYPSFEVNLAWMSYQRLSLRRFTDHISWACIEATGGSG